MEGNFNKNKLGSGIYTIPDIALILRYPQHKIRRYINRYWDSRLGEPIFNSSYTWSIDGRVKAVNFYTLIELFIFIKLQEQGVKTKTILNARYKFIKDFKTPYPFAFYKLLTDKRNIWFVIKENIIDSDGTRQLNIEKIINEFVEKVEFNENNIVTAFWPAGKSSSVVINPHHQFGKPIITGTNISAEILYFMHESGESIKTISKLYSISDKFVNDAIRFFKSVA